MVVPTLLLLLLLQENVVDAFFLVQPTTRKTETKRLQQQPLALFQMAAVSVPLGDDQDDENDKGDKRNENNNQQVSIAFTQERGGGGGGSSMTLVVIQKWYTKYLRAIDQRPLLTKGLTAAVVNVLGDILAQYLQASSSGVKLCLNWARLQTFFLCGWIYIGPYVHTWYEQLWKLGKWMETRWGSPKQVQTIAQILVDQTLGVALFFSTYFYVYEVMDALVNRRRKYSVSVMKSITSAILYLSLRELN